jgi:tetratricopeptide (TPR) repeat protein
MRLLSILVAALLLGGCSLPRVIVLNDPLNARQHNDLGVSYQQRNELDLALREYDRAGELDSGWARPLVNSGNVHAARNDWQQAEKNYRLALRREPGNGDALNNLAWVLLQSGETAAALAWAQQAVAANPREPAFLDTLAEIRIARREYSAARQSLEQALALSPAEELLGSLKKKLNSLDQQQQQSP